MPVSVWVDQARRVRQIVYQMPLPLSAPASSTSTTTPASATTAPVSATTAPVVTGQITATIDFDHFGAPVNVTAPPSAQVYDATNQALAASPTTTAIASPATAAG